MLVYKDKLQTKRASLTVGIAVNTLAEPLSRTIKLQSISHNVINNKIETQRNNIVPAANGNL